MRVHFAAVALALPLLSASCVRAHIPEVSPDAASWWTTTSRFVVVVVGAHLIQHVVQQRIPTVSPPDIAEGIRSRATPGCLLTGNNSEIDIGGCSSQ